jgi:succinate dehydrogenase flavin-adding protein (antitoxin of CptAB toxin-antitoxin module)
MKILDMQDLSKLKWRARRGLLENDIILTKFFNRYDNTLTTDDANALEILLGRVHSKKEWENNHYLLNLVNILQKI